MGYFPGPVLQYSSTVSIPRTELLLDSIETYVIREEIFDKGSLERQAEKYYSNESDGFYIHAYAGLSIILPKKGFPILSFKNKSYQNMEHLLSTISYRFQYPVNSQIDSVYLEIPPLLVLPYPMQLGQSWNFRNSGDPYLIVKRVVDRETITTKSGRFTADVIQWLYDFDANGQWDDDITYLDYYSSVGLVKRSITFLNIALVDQGGNAIGYVDFSEISELKSYIVNP
jgi:hypothetical protein